MPSSQRLLSKPDALLEKRVTAWPQLWPMLEALLNVVCRRDGNPFALTRLLRAACLRADGLVQTSPAAMQAFLVDFNVVSEYNEYFKRYGLSATRPQR